jgi:hypothetical protein
MYSRFLALGVLVRVLVDVATLAVQVHVELLGGELHYGAIGKHDGDAYHLLSLLWLPTPRILPLYEPPRPSWRLPSADKHVTSSSPEEAPDTVLIRGAPFDGVELSHELFDLLLKPPDTLQGGLCLTMLADRALAHHPAMCSWSRLYKIEAIPFCRLYSRVGAVCLREAPPQAAGKLPALASGPTSALAALGDGWVGLSGA